MKRQNLDWRQIVEEQAASGKSIQEYCKEIGIHPNTFYRKRKAHEGSAMVEVRPASSIEVGPLMVNVGRYSVVIRSDFDAAALRSVLEVLAELQ